MPTKPHSPCAKNGCPNFASKHGLCEQHVKEYNIKRYSNPTLYDARWQKARELYLQEHPLCVECAKEGKVNTADTLDHIEPHKGDMNKFWNVLNWQSLCKRHHDVKTIQGR